jgi:hypothetical protein
MGIAAGVGAYRPAPPPLGCSVRAHVDRRFPPGDRPCRGCNGNCPTAWRAQSNVSDLRRSTARTRRPLRRRLPGFAKAISDCYSNQHRQHPFRIEILDSERRVHWAFARPAAGRWDRREMRWCPAAVSTRHSAPAIPIAALNLKAEATARFPDGCQLVDFELLRL